MSLAAWLNAAWMLQCTPEAWAFQKATRQVAPTQTDVLRRLLQQNRDTDFGRRHRFGLIRSAEDYQRRVPLACYEDFAPAIERIAAGEPNVLTRECVELLEPTSGTTGGEKLIPFTASLRRQFQRGVSAWIADLFRHRPGVRAGRAYWSISPALGPARGTAAGIPIGFADDAAYLGMLERRALDHLLVVRGAAARLESVDSCRYCTLLALLRAPDLALISIWNPTFLSTLLVPLEGWLERLCFDLRHGSPHPPTPLPAAIARQFQDCPNDLRAREVEAIFRSRATRAAQLRQLWPRLALISCWADATAAHGLNPLREHFPSVEIQAKGLLATEGCVSFPLIGQPAPALALRSHFFEFQELKDTSSACRLAHELERGGRYRLVLTTAGGLYRYQLRDEVEIAGFMHQCPLLRFLGKSDRISDLVGEKLAEVHVRTVLDRIFRSHAITVAFALLVPVLDQPPRYRLYFQGPAQTAIQRLLVPLQTDLENGLEENPYYRHAVRFGQLAAAEMCLLSPDAEAGWQVFERRCLERGQKAGNIKPAVLDCWTGWPGEFAGCCLAWTSA